MLSTEDIGQLNALFEEPLSDYERTDRELTFQAYFANLNREGEQTNLVQLR
jgi:hypothetical protein